MVGRKRVIKSNLCEPRGSVQSKCRNSFLAALLTDLVKTSRKKDQSLPNFASLYSCVR